MSSKPHNPYTMRRHLLDDPAHRPKIADVRKLVELVDWQDALIAEVTRQRDCLERENDELRDIAETERQHRPGRERGGAMTMTREARERHPLQGEVWSIIRRAMDTPHTDEFEAESAYRDAFASEAAGKVIELLTTSIIAAFEQALLQPEVVTAAAKGMCTDGLVGDGDLNDARAALQAALAAAKGTEGGA